MSSATRSFSRSSRPTKSSRTARVLAERTEAGPRAVLRVSIVNGRGRPLGRRDLASWLARVMAGRARGDVVVALVSDPTIRRLNRRFRHVDRATDVLSFPAADPPINLSKSKRNPGFL